MVERDSHALAGHPVAEPAEPLQEHRPLVLAHHRAVGDRYGPLSLHRVRRFGKDHDLTAARPQQLEVRPHRHDLRLNIAVAQRSAVPAGYEAQAMPPQHSL